MKDDFDDKEKTEGEEEERLLDPEIKDEERELDVTLRPRWITEFVGQDRNKEQLQISISAALKRGEPCDLLGASRPGEDDAGRDNSQ